MAGRAKKATIERLEPFLAEVRALGIDGLIQKANGAFYRKRTPILHFHEDADGVYADVKVDGDWERVTVERAAGNKKVLSLLRQQHLP